MWDLKKFLTSSARWKSTSSNISYQTVARYENMWEKYEEKVYAENINISSIVIIN